MSGVLGMLDSLLGASFRGVPFHLPDTRLEIGRRVVRHWFPGRDDTIHQDLGLYEGGISVTGLIIGDDYVADARSLAAAFAEKGPGTLVHPWLGDRQVVLARPATISYSDREIRVARFEATFEPWSDPAAKEGSGGLLDTLSDLLDTVRQVRDQVRQMLVTVLAPVRQAVALFGAVAGFVGSVEGICRGLLGPIVGGAGLLGLLDLPFRALGGIGALLGGDDYGPEVADRIGAIPLAIAAAGAPPLPPAIGPAAGAVVVVDSVVPPEVAARLLLDAAAAIAVLPCAVPALPIATAAALRAEAAVLAGDIEHRSSQDAAAWRDAVVAAIAASADDAVGLAATLPAVAMPLWTALQDLRSATVADFSARIGRLPRVEILPPRAGAVSVWHIAQHLAGADPAAVTAMVDDLVRRNRLAQPGLVPADLPIEYLAP